MGEFTKAEELLGECRCDPAYKDRGLVQPDCEYCHLGEDIQKLIDSEKRLQEECEVWKEQFERMADARDLEVEKGNKWYAEVGKLNLEIQELRAALKVSSADQVYILAKEVERLRDVLDILVGIGIDYDGASTVETLKGVIDDIVELASKARKGELA